MRRIAAASKEPGVVYFAGGSCMLLLGVRDQTIDVNLKLDPEPLGVFEAIARLKDELDINVELAAPDDFIPALADWRENSPLIETMERVAFHHCDFRTQALAKLERGHVQDLRKVSALLSRGVVDRDGLLAAFEQVRPNLFRFPAIDAGGFEEKVTGFFQALDQNESRGS